jgi:hypothetical protein
MKKFLNSPEWAELAVFDNHYNNLLSKWPDNTSELTLNQRAVLSYFEVYLKELKLRKPN